MDGCMDGWSLVRLVYGRVTIFGEEEGTAAWLTHGVDHDVHFDDEKPLFFPDARSSDILCAYV